MLQIFNNELFGEIRVGLINNEVWFVGRDVVERLGYDLSVNSYTKYIKQFVEEEDVINYSKETQVSHRLELDYKLLGQRGGLLVNEYGLYDLIMSSSLPQAKAFKKWVTHEILPQLRKSGVVILEHAKEDAISFESKYGIRRIRKTFRNSTDIEADWEEYKRLSKIERNAKRINNMDRVKLCEIIKDELEIMVADNISSWKVSKVFLYKEIITDIANEITRLNNKYRGGLLSANTKKLKEKDREIEELRTIIDNNNNELMFTTLDYHGFSNNYMYDYTNGRIARSSSYNNWIDNFPKNQIPSRNEYIVFEGINFFKPMGIEIRYVAKDKFDIRNLDKSFIDMLFNRILRIDDSILYEVKSYRVGTCDSYEDGKIMFAIYNC